MEPLSALITCLLLAVGTVTAQTGSRNSSERLLPQWLTGIIAVSCFLLVSFIFFMAKKMWCEKSSGRGGSEDSVRDEDLIDGNPYDTRLEDLRRKRSTKAKDNEYDTKLDAVRKEKHSQPLKDSADDTYESSISIIRRDKDRADKDRADKDRGDKDRADKDRADKDGGDKDGGDKDGGDKDGGDVSSYATSLDLLRSRDGRTSYDNPVMDSSEDRSTVM